VRCVKISVREFGDHDGSSPRTSTVGAPPPAGTTQMSNSDVCDVNAIHLPSGEQSGSVGFGAPGVGICCIAPPPAGTFASTRRSAIFVAKQIHCPSGDQHGDESSLLVVNRFKSVPSALPTQTFGLPLLLKIIATFEPSGETAALVFKPE
jgi:hypothetical protein